MKRFGNGGKIVGLMLLALGLVFAGCAGSGGSSNGSNGASPSAEAAAPATDQESYATVPISITPDPAGGGAIAIGADGMSDLTTSGGHNIEIKAGDTTATLCTGLGGGDVRCWIKLINRDPSYAMYNANFAGGKCTNCTSATEDNADNVAGDTTKPIGGANVSVPVNLAGYCYTEDGNFKAKKPFNALGCSTYYTPPAGANPSVKPMQVLHPECGARSELWDFGNQVPKYTFYGSVTATWFPWNPLGADGIPNNGDDPDSRMDFQNFSTVYLILTNINDIANANANPGATRYNWGSWKRSRTIAGWGSPGNVSKAALGVGNYFAVNVAIEAPDRVENYYVADRQHLANNPQGYEYYTMGAVFFRYNPFVVERVRSNVHAGRAWVKRAGQYFCYTSALCQTIGAQTYDHLEAIADGTNSMYGYGWIAMYRNLNDVNPNFTYYGGGGLSQYVTENGGLIHFTAGAKVCGECGQKGLAKMNRGFLGLTITSANTSAGNPAYVKDGPDAEPENTYLVYHFFVKSSAKVGQASEIRADVYSTYTQFQWALHQNLATLFPFGPTNGDYTQYCYPFYTGGGNVQYCQLPIDMTNLNIVQNKERQNKNILQSGEVVVGGGGGVQSWSTYVCVQ